MKVNYIKYLKYKAFSINAFKDIKIRSIARRAERWECGIDSQIILDWEIRKFKKLSKI